MCVVSVSVIVCVSVFTVSFRIVSWVLGSRSHRVIALARQTLRFVARSSSAFGLLPLLLLALLPAACCCCQCCQCCLETLADHAAKTVYICFSACSHTLTDTVCDSASERASSVSQSVCLCVSLSVCCACVCLCVSAKVCVSECASVCGVQAGVATEWPTGVAWPNRRRQYSSLLQLLAWFSPGRVGSGRVWSSQVESALVRCITCSASSYIWSAQQHQQLQPELCSTVSEQRCLFSFLFCFYLCFLRSAFCFPIELSFFSNF